MWKKLDDNRVLLDGRRCFAIPLGWHPVKAGRIREGDRVYLDDDGPKLFSDPLLRGFPSVGSRVSTKRLVIRRDAVAANA